MLEQAALALPLQPDPRWLERPLLDGRTLAALTGLNCDFLSLVAAEAAAHPGMPVFGLPPHLAAGLGPALDCAGGRLALPYALFDLRFRDARFWQSQAAAAVAVRDTRGATAVDGAGLPFARAAVTFAWHLVQRDGTAARLALGLDDGTESVLDELPVGSLDALARRAAPVLAARFGARERFWELVAACREEQAVTPERLARIGLLGQQLLGTDAARLRQLHRRARRSTQA